MKMEDAMRHATSPEMNPPDLLMAAAEMLITTGRQFAEVSQLQVAPFRYAMLANENYLKQDDERQTRLLSFVTETSGSDGRRAPRIRRQRSSYSPREGPDDI